MARAVADSPLVKTAMHGCDPNWGRVMSSAGAALAGRELPEASLELCGVRVVESAASPVVSLRPRVSTEVAMKEPEIDMELGLDEGDHRQRSSLPTWDTSTSTINAEYHS